MKAPGMWMESWVLAYLLNSLWQIPLVFGAAWAAARLARQAGPQMEHRVWVSALMLEAILPLCPFHLGDLWPHAWGLMLLWGRGAATAGGQTRVIVGAGAASGIAVLRLPAEILAAVAAAYACSVLYFIGRLGWGLCKTEAMRRRAEVLTLTGDMPQRFDRCKRLLGIGSGAVRIAMSPAVAGPVTVGVYRQTLLLPPRFLENVNADDLDAVLAHEFAHIRRRDFAKNLLYGAVSLPAAYHPLLSLTRARLAETREMICDSLAAEAVMGRESYARSLLRLAAMLSDRTSPKSLHAIGIFDANIFERRVMNLTKRRFEIRGVRRFAIAAACGLVALATCTSALTLRLDVGTSATESQPPTKIKVKSASLTILYKRNPVYPAEAKANKNTLNGVVVLEVTIGKDGLAQNIKVKKSLRPDYDRSAIDAVSQWRWQPYHLNGEPIEVVADVTVVYSLKP